MTGEIQIQGDLKFVGYRQLSTIGSNGQFLSYHNGTATWANVPSNHDDQTLTTNIGNTVLVDRKGNLIISREETYVGIDTRGRAITDTEDIASLVQTLDILIGAWAAPTIPDGTLRQTFIHTLNTENLIAQFSEQLMLPGRFLDVFVPWRTLNNNTIEACIPVSSAFAGKVRII